MYKHMFSRPGSGPENSRYLVLQVQGSFKVDFVYLRSEHIHMHTDKSMKALQLYAYSCSPCYRVTVLRSHLQAGLSRVLVLLQEIPKGKLFVGAEFHEPLHMGWLKKVNTIYRRGMIAALLDFNNISSLCIDVDASRGSACIRSPTDSGNALFVWRT
jgi:hypothetical protein